MTKKHGLKLSESDRKNVKKYNFASGGKDGFYRDLWMLVLPIAFQNLMNAAVSAADVVMVGLVSQTALSAVSLASQVQFVLNLFYAGLTIGTVLRHAGYVAVGSSTWSFLRICPKAAGRNRIFDYQHG